MKLIGLDYRFAYVTRIADARLTRAERLSALQMRSDLSEMAETMIKTKISDIMF